MIKSLHGLDDSKVNFWAIDVVMRIIMVGIYAFFKNILCSIQTNTQAQTPTQDYFYLKKHEDYYTMWVILIAIDSFDQDAKIYKISQYTPISIWLVHDFLKLGYVIKKFPTQVVPLLRLRGLLKTIIFLWNKLHYYIKSDVIIRFFWRRFAFL